MLWWHNPSLPLTIDQLLCNYACKITTSLRPRGWAAGDCTFCVIYCLSKTSARRAGARRLFVSTFFSPLPTLKFCHSLLKKFAPDSLLQRYNCLVSATTHAWVWGVLIMSREKKKSPIISYLFSSSARAERHRCDKFNPRSFFCVCVCVSF